MQQFEKLHLYGFVAAALTGKIDLRVLIRARTWKKLSSSVNGKERSPASSFSTSFHVLTMASRTLVWAIYRCGIGV